MTDPYHGDPVDQPPEPPANVEAEQALLGAILAQNEALDRVADFLTPDQFYEEVHGRIYERCVAMIGRGEIANAVTLKTAFERDDALKEAGGARYLAELQGTFVSVINARDYGRAINDAFIRRRALAAIEFLGEEMRNFDDPDQQARQVLEQHVAECDAIITREHGTRGLVSMGQDADRLKTAIDEAIERHRSGRASGISTGFPRLDKILCGGFRGGRFVVLGGAPSMGKTALALGISERVATKEGAVAFFSQEMTNHEIELRLACSRAGVDVGSSLRGDMSYNDADILKAEIDALRELPIYIDDSVSLTPSGIRSRSRRLLRSTRLRLIVIDYLQLMTGTQKGVNRTGELTAITRALKLLSNELDVPVLLLSQLTRDYAKRDNHRPQLSDLRESGSIEQDADDVLFVHRDAYYMERAGPPAKSKDEIEWRADLDAKKGLAEVIVAKQRMGPLGVVELGFTPKTTRFRDFEEDQSELAF